MNLRGNRFRHGVDDVRAHRIAHVDVEVDHEDPLLLVEHSNVEVTTPAASLHHPGDSGVGDFENSFALRFDQDLGLRRVRHLVELNLRGHDGRSCLPEEATRHSNLTCRVRCGGDHGRLLDGHGHEHISIVDPEVEGDGQGQAVHGDDVFAHAIGHVERQFATALEMPNRFLGE